MRHQKLLLVYLFITFSLSAERPICIPLQDDLYYEPVHQRFHNAYACSIEPTPNKTIASQLWISLKTAFSKVFYTKKSFLKGIDPTQWAIPTTDAIAAIRAQTDNPRVTWIGHATFLIQVGGKNILTDPVVGHINSILYRRIAPSIINIKDLPNIDYIIISHNHRDHLDEATLKDILKHQKRAPDILIPYGNEELLRKAGFPKNKIHGSFRTWWTEFTSNNIKFTFLPARHSSNRKFSDINKAAWGSWMIEKPPFTAYFAGDTDYASHFKQIGKKFPHIMVALIPIAPNFSKPKAQAVHHMSAREACYALEDLSAHYGIAMHWGTFKLGTDTFMGPIELFLDEAKTQLPDLYKNLIILKFGQTAMFLPDGTLKNQALLDKNRESVLQ